MPGKFNKRFKAIKGHDSTMPVVLIHRGYIFGLSAEGMANYK